MSALHYELPGVAALRFPLSRSRTLLFFVGVNLLFLGLDTFLGHVIDGVIRAYEWIPVFHGPLAGLVVLWVVFRPRPSRGEVVLLLLALASSLAVGLMGTAFHWQRAMLVRGGTSGSFLEWLIFAPPAAGPSAFMGVALIGLLAALHEVPRDSGQMDLWGLVQFRAPLTKTQQLLWLVGLGYAGATLSSALDHARSGFVHPTTWIAVLAGAFATAVTLGRASSRKPTPADDSVHFWTNVALMGVGVLGFAMHLDANLTGRGEISLERLVSHAPVMAPLLLVNLGLLGLIAVMRPSAQPSASA